MVHPESTLLGLNQPCIPQNLEMMGNRRLGEIETRLDVAHTDFRIRLMDDVEHLHPHRMADRLEQRSEMLGFLIAHGAGRAAALANLFNFDHRIRRVRRCTHDFQYIHYIEVCQYSTANWLAET